MPASQAEAAAESHLVWQEGETCFDYDVGCLSVGDAESRRKVYL